MSWLDLSWAEEHPDLVLRLKEDSDEPQETTLNLNSIIVGSSSGVWKSQLQGDTVGTTEPPAEALAILPDCKHYLEVTLPHFVSLDTVSTWLPGMLYHGRVPDTWVAACEMAVFAHSEGMDKVFSLCTSTLEDMELGEVDEVLNAAECSLPMLLPLAGSGGADGCISKILIALSNITPAFVDDDKVTAKGENADQEAAARALLTDAIQEVDSDDVVWAVISHEWPRSLKAESAAKGHKELIEGRVTEEMLVDALKADCYWGYHQRPILHSRLQHFFGTPGELLKDSEKFKFADETATALGFRRFWTFLLPGCLNEEEEVRLLLKLVEKHPDLDFGFDALCVQLTLSQMIASTELRDLAGLKKVCRFGEGNWLAKCQALEAEKEEALAKVQQLEREKQEVLKHNKSLQRWNKKLNGKLRNAGIHQWKPENS